MEVIVKSLIYIDGLLLLGLLFFRWALVDRMKPLIDARVFTLVLLIPALMLVVPKVEFAYAVLLVAAMAVRTRPELCAGYLLMLPLVPELTQEYSISGAYVGRLTAMSALAVGALLAFSWTQRTTRIRMARYDVAVAALIIMLTIIEARGSPLTSYARLLIEQFLTIGAPYVIVSRSVGSESDARIVLSRFYLAGALCAGIAIFEATRHWALYEFMATRLGISFSDIAELNIRAGFMRSGGPFLNPTAFAFFLAILPAGLWGIRSYFTAVGYRALTALMLVGLLATQSRGAWIACAAGYCACWAYRGLKGRVVGGVVGAAALYALVSVVLPENGRLAESLGRTGAAAETADYRKQLLQSGLEQVRAHPLIGQPSANVQAAMIHLKQGQGIVDFVNAHLYVALGGGLVALTIWLMVWATPLFASWSGKSPVGREPSSDLQIIPETILVVSMVGLCFTSTAFKALVWPTIALGLTGPTLALAARKRPVHRREDATPLVDRFDQVSGTPARADA